MVQLNDAAFDLSNGPVMDEVRNFYICTSTSLAFYVSITPFFWLYESTKNALVVHLSLHISRKFILGWAMAPHPLLLKIWVFFSQCTRLYEVIILTQIKFWHDVVRLIHWTPPNSHFQCHSLCRYYFSFLLIKWICQWPLIF